jgi:exodeoxyribonuclease-3
VALLSREPATDVVRNIPGFDDDQARVIAGTVARRARDRRLFPERPGAGSDKFAYKMRWQDALRDWVRANWRRTRSWC